MKSRPRPLQAPVAVGFLLIGLIFAPASAQRDAGDLKPLLDRVETLRNKGTPDSLREALPLFETARAQARASHDANAEADAITGVGRCHDALGDKAKALTFYAEALQLYRATARKGGEAQVLNFTALALDFLGERQKALSTLDEALPIAREAHDTRVEGLTLNNLGLVHANIGDKRKALDFYEQALPLHRQAGNLRGEAITLGNIGVVYGDLGEKTKGLEYMLRALPLRRQAGDPYEVAVQLNNIGVAHFGLDRWDQAIDFYNQAIAEWHVAANRSGEAATLHNIANVYEFTGQYQQALDFYKQALPLHRANAYRAGEGNTLTNMGRLYGLLGDPRRSIDSLTEALAVHRAVGNRNSEVVALSSLATDYLTIGDGAKAAELLNQALPMARTIGDRSTEAAVLNNLGRLYAQQHDFERALDSHAQALTLFQAVGSRRGEGSTLALLGAAQAELGDHDTARTTYERALVLMREVSHRGGEAQTLYQMATLERARGNLPEARLRAEAALDVIESLRTSVARSDLRSSYFASVQDYYELAVDVLMRLHRQQPAAGYAVAALQTSEQARARSLLDLLAEAGADIRNGVDPALLDRARTIERTINDRAERLARVVAGQTREQAIQLARDIESLTAEYQDVDVRIRAASPRYAAITERHPVSGDRIEALVDADTRLMEFSLGKDRSYLWVVSPEGVAGYELPPRAAIEAAARAFTALVAAGPAADPTAAAVRLSQMIFAPAADRLAAKRLVIVADGALQYVPFAALTTASGFYRPLVLDHEIISVPSASTLAVLREEFAGRTPAPRTLAILADPVFRFDDPRVERAAAIPRRPAARPHAPAGHADAAPAVRRSDQANDDPDAFASLPRLIGSRREAARIAALLPAAERKEALDFDASRATIVSPEIAGYRIVHFATHGLLNTSHPDLSGIVLSLVDRRGQPQNGFLRLHDIYNLRLSSDLVVLSACQTALGKDVRGEGLVGLARGFMYAGSPRVVASLWKVDDRATSELMVRFYQAMLGHEHLAPAAALRAAQMSISKQSGWRSPYYWAGFVLQGEWK